MREAFRLSQNQLPAFMHISIRPSSKWDAVITLSAVQQELKSLFPKPEAAIIASTAESLID